MTQSHDWHFQDIRKELAHLSNEMVQKLLSLQSEAPELHTNGSIPSIQGSSSTFLSMSAAGALSSQSSSKGQHSMTPLEFQRKIQRFASKGTPTENHIFARLGIRARPSHAAGASWEWDYPMTPRVRLNSTVGALLCVLLLWDTVVGIPARPILHCVCWRPLQIRMDTKHKHRAPQHLRRSHVIDTRACGAITIGALKLAR